MFEAIVISSRLKDVLEAARAIVTEARQWKVSPLKAVGMRFLERKHVRHVILKHSVQRLRANTSLQYLKSSLRSIRYLYYNCTHMLV